MASRAILKDLRSRATNAAYQVASHLGYKFVLDQYVHIAPNPQSAVDIFKGEWASQLPPPYEHLTGGQSKLFEDSRITWLLENVGDLTGKTVLELGPLEGGHSYMLERHGAEQVVAVEGNSRAYLKCLIVKELLQLQRVRFLLGDFVEYLRNDGPAFELCVASGVLYHMQNPAELIALLAARCMKYVYLWTHYYDPAVIKSSPKLASKFTESSFSEHRGFQHSLHRYNYQGALFSGAFCGGSAPFSRWLTREDLFGCLKHFGFERIRVQFDEPDHPHGPCISLLAERAADGA